MKSIFLLFFAICITRLSSVAQAPGMASGITSLIIRKNMKANDKNARNQIADSDSNVVLAYQAYSKGDLELTKKYLEDAEEHGRVSDKFYTLLGQYYLDKKQYKYAKRYWIRGVEKKQCVECENKLKENEALLKDF